MSRISNHINNINIGKNHSTNVVIGVPAEAEKSKPPVVKENPPIEKTLFISHASMDKDIVGPFVKMLIDAGFPREKLLYSSAPALGVPLGEKIEDHLLRKLTEGTFAIFMLSHNWYASTVCGSERGVVWSKNIRHCNVLLPGFSYQDIRGVAPTSELSASYDDDTSVLRDKLGQLRRQLEKHFDMEFIDTVWESSRDQFLGSIHCDPAVPRA